MDEKELRREFEAFGPIKDMRFVYNTKTQHRRTYVFIEYDNERDVRGKPGRAFLSFCSDTVLIDYNFVITS
jgi:hypothetical protein